MYGYLIHSLQCDKAIAYYTLCERRTNVCVMCTIKILVHIPREHNVTNSMYDTSNYDLITTVSNPWTVLWPAPCVCFDN